MITSVTLGGGAVRMARKQVIAKHFPAIRISAASTFSVATRREH
jgi:hypothetical protein